MSDQPTPLRTTEASPAASDSYTPKDGDNLWTIAHTKLQEYMQIQGHEGSVTSQQISALDKAIAKENHIRITKAGVALIHAGKPLKIPPIADVIALAEKLPAAGKNQTQTLPHAEAAVNKPAPVIPLSPGVAKPDVNREVAPPQTRSAEPKAADGAEVQFPHIQGRNSDPSKTDHGMPPPLSREEIASIKPTGDPEFDKILAQFKELANRDDKGRFEHSRVVSPDLRCVEGLDRVQGGNALSVEQLRQQYKAKGLQLVPQSADGKVELRPGDRLIAFRGAPIDHPGEVHGDSAFVAGVVPLPKLDPNTHKPITDPTTGQWAVEPTVVIGKFYTGASDQTRREDKPGYQFERIDEYLRTQNKADESKYGQSLNYGDKYGYARVEVWRKPPAR